MTFSMTIAVLGKGEYKVSNYSGIGLNRLKELKCSWSIQIGQPASQVRSNIDLCLDYKTFGFTEK
jgi:hypothetical protein